MTKRKKIILSVIAACCAVLIGLGGFFGVREHLKNRITFTVDDTLPDGGGKKATVILLGGQSNAAGATRDEYLQKKVSAEQYAAYENGYENVYVNYYISGTNQSQGFVKCTTKQGEAGGFFGPELGMAEKLNALYPDEQFFIIKCAWSGTNLQTQWTPPSSDGKTGPLYKEFVAYVEASLEYLVSKNYDVSIAGMCWMQGESDAASLESAAEYEENLRNLIKDLRQRFSRYAAEDGIAFIDAYIADNPAYWVHYELVNEAKKRVAAGSSINALVDTISHGLSCSEEPEGAPDMAHYDSLSEINLGHLFAEELSRFLE